MSKKILSAVLAIAMVVSLCASLFTVGASAATNYEADRDALKKAIQELFTVGPDVDKETRDFLFNAGILTDAGCDKCDLTKEEIERSKVFKVTASCEKGCNKGGSYDGSDLGYFFKDAASFDAEAYKAMILEAATAYYFGQDADTTALDESFNEGRNAIVKSQLKVINDYIADLEDEVGAYENKPAKYAEVFADWKATNAKYNPGYGINPYGDDYSNADWYQILQNYNGIAFGWISFETIKADAAKADLLVKYERLYRAAQTNKVEGKLFYYFVLEEKAALENAWNALIGSFKKEEIKWELPSAESVAAAIKEYNNMVKVLDFFNKYIVDTYLNVYDSADAKLLANVAYANSVKEFVSKFDNTKASPYMAMYIGAIGASTFKAATDNLIASIAALDPAASNLAITNEDIATAVALINEAQALYNAYARYDVFTNADKKMYYNDYAALKSAIDALKVLVTYDADTYASYVIPADSSAKIWDVTGVEVGSNDKIVVTFAPRYFVLVKYMLDLQDALDAHLENVEAFNNTISDKLGSITGDGSAAPAPAPGYTTSDKSELVKVLETYDFLAGEKLSVKDGVATPVAGFKDIASEYTAKFVAMIASEEHESKGFVVDPTAIAQYNQFVEAFENGLAKHNVSGVNYKELADAITALLPYLTASLAELINLYAYEATVLADFFGVNYVVMGKVGSADYQNPENYLGYKTGDKTFSGKDEAVTVSDLLEIIADYVDLKGTLDLVDGSATIDNETVKAILAKINVVITYFNENIAGSYELPKLDNALLGDIIKFTFENKDDVQDAIVNILAKVEAAITDAFNTVFPDSQTDFKTATGYASVAYGLVKLYEGYTGEDIKADEILGYVNLDMSDIEDLMNKGLSIESIKELAIEKITEVLAKYTAKFEKIDTEEELYAAILEVNKLIQWYNANVANVYTIDAIELLPTDVYKVDATFDIDQIWEKLTADIDGSIVVDGLVKPGVDTKVKVLTGGAYYDMMQSFFKLSALVYGANMKGEDLLYTTDYAVKANASALNAARNEFIASVKNLLTDDRGDELVDEFTADVYSWVKTDYVKQTASGTELYETLVDIFGEGADCSALALPKAAAEPYLYYNFNLKHIVNHTDLNSNKYSVTNGKYDLHILDPLEEVNSMKEISSAELSQYDRAWVARFTAIRTEAGYLYNKIKDASAIPADITLAEVLAVIAKVDDIMDEQDDHHIDVLALYKESVLFNLIDKATGLSMYDYSDASAWAAYEAAYAAAVAAKYDRRMPKETYGEIIGIDDVVADLETALKLLADVAKPESSATIADLEAKMDEAVAFMDRADDRNTSAKIDAVNALVSLLNTIKSEIANHRYDLYFNNSYDIEARINDIQAAMDVIYEAQTFGDDLAAHVNRLFYAIKENQDAYTIESLVAFYDACSKATIVAQNNTLKASEYIAEMNKVGEAYAAIELKPAPEKPVEPEMTKTFEAAVAKLAELKAVSTDGYTAESVAAFNSAVAALQAGINEVAEDDALLELIANAYIAKASLAAEVKNPETCD